MTDNNLPALDALADRINAEHKAVPDGELTEALTSLAPVAKGDIAGLDIDWGDLGATPPTKNLHRFSGRRAKSGVPYEAAFVVAVLTIDAQWLCGGLLNEMEDRYSTYKDLPDDEYADLYRSECDEILDSFQADCQRKHDEVKTAISEGRYADI